MNSMVLAIEVNWVPVNEALLAEHDIVVDEAKIIYGYTAEMANPSPYSVIKPTLE